MWFAKVIRALAMKQWYKVLAAAIVALGLASPLPAAASATFQGLTFTFIQVDADTLTFEISGTPSGDWTGVQFLGAFDLKDLGLDFSVESAIANGPGATNLAGLNSQLAASNLDCSKTTGQAGSVCFDISPDVALGTLPFDFVYTIDFSAPLNIADTGVHLQIAFMNVEGGDKVGSLYSQSVGLDTTDVTDITDVTDVTDVTVPEPGTTFLLGVAILALGLLRRRVTR
jgi:PEP-CTERM motif-containing protein